MVMRYFKKSKLLAALMVVFVLAAGTFLPSNTALAKEVKPTLSSTGGTVFMYTEDSLTVENIPGGLEKISWSTSDDDVLKVKSNSKTGTECRLLPQKTGTSTVTCTVVTSDKTYTLESKITVKKASPFKKIYINDKNKYKSKTSSITYDSEGTGKVKVTAKLNKGWSLVSKEYQVYNTETQMKSTKDVPSNNKVPVGKYQTKVNFTAKNDSDEYFTYSVIIKKVVSPTAKPSFAKKSGTIFLKTTNNTLAVKNFPGGATAVWSSSDASVATVTKSSDSEGIAVLKPLKKGTTTITCVVTKKDNTTRTITYALTVKNKVSPLEAVKVDGSNILRKTKTNYYKMKTTDHSMLVQSYENSGWSIKDETYVQYTTPTLHGNETDVAGDGTVNIGAYKSVVNITLKNKSGVYYTFTLEIFNSNYKK
jgi:hypothetical protein